MGKLIYLPGFFNDLIHFWTPFSNAIWDNNSTHFRILHLFYKKFFTKLPCKTRFNFDWKPEGGRPCKIRADCPIWQPLSIFSCNCFKGFTLSVTRIESFCRQASHCPDVHSRWPLGWCIRLFIEAIWHIIWKRCTTLSIDMSNSRNKQSEVWD